MRRAVAPLLVFSCLACHKLRAVPPGPAPDRSSMQVNASFGRTWDAVIDYFAKQNIPIRTIERASGIIAAEALSVSADDALEWADCGQVPMQVPKGGRMGGTEWKLVPVPAERAFFNFLVRGDSTRSTVLATVRWSVPERTVFAGRSSYVRPWVDCSTTGAWEGRAESNAKSAAEAATAARRE